jgi:hypothetical protein
MKAKEILLEYGSVKKAVDNYKLANWKVATT